MTNMMPAKLEDSTWFDHRSEWVEFEGPPSFVTVLRIIKFYQEAFFLFFSMVAPSEMKCIPNFHLTENHPRSCGIQ